MHVNWHWPADATDPNNHYVPWYVMAWRTPWFVLIVGGRSLIFLGVWGASLSLDEALYEWRGCK